MNYVFVVYSIYINHGSVDVHVEKAFEKESNAWIFIEDSLRNVFKNPNYTTYGARIKVHPHLGCILTYSDIECGLVEIRYLIDKIGVV